MDKFKLEYKPYGENGLLIEWPRMVDETILHDILKFRSLVETSFKDYELIPAYNSLTLVSSGAIDFNPLIRKLKQLYRETHTLRPVKRNVWHIPVCYDDFFGIDMEVFSLEKKMSSARIVELHTAPLYTIYCIGFLPGFMYLGGLNEALHHPRRTKPRLKIPQGSVGIGGEQTGVYPQESPGGWNIIGNSPVKIFNPANKNPCGVAVGDKIKFYSIDKAEHELISIQVEAKIFHLKTYQLDGTSN